ncbi:hypothetical protein H5410_051910 [Solanum commersonii]|uniref:Uncharacterized protein n=1 Tax=Solanum commersonii TaxID=4109 RepID=A0A9J5WZR5_SOLCO|nr:hypothetical protein H5410_051910 [Solanum commersonii]
MERGSTPHNIPSVIKFGHVEGPSVITTRAIEELADGGLKVSSHPVIHVKFKKPVDVEDSVQAPCEDSALLCNKSGHLLFVILHLGIPINLPLDFNIPSIWLADH